MDGRSDHSSSQGGRLWYAKAEKLGRKCKRFWSSYRCHRLRNKTHLQITLDLLAKLVRIPAISTWLRQISLECHSIRNGLKPADVLSRKGIAEQAVQREDLLCGRFFLDVQDDQLWATYRSQFESRIQEVIEDAETICRHEFDLLGSGICYWGHPINWHVDPISGYSWPKKFYTEIQQNNNSSTGLDVKLPWELSRMQHLPTLGKAYRLTKDERYAREIVEQITHWLDENPCPYGINWTCAMDVAIRIMNITWAYKFIEDTSVVTDQLRVRLAVSIFQHAQFVLFNLEYSIRDDGSITNGNHYLTNIIGLLHVGVVCPEFSMAATYRRMSVQALVNEMDCQVYADGSNFESSISYHRLVLELFIAGALLCRVNQITLPRKFWERLEAMFEFVLLIIRPDGRVPQVGDADDGRLYILSDYGKWDRTDFRYLLSIGAALFHRSDFKAHARRFSEEAFWLLGPAGMATFAALEDDKRKLGSKGLHDSGLYVMRADNEYLLACCGTVGTGGIGNHKHNDLLSFELYANDKAFIVDPGAYIYTRQPCWRNLFRSTRYHNTAVIDAQEQNRFETDNLFAMKSDSTVIVHRWCSTTSRDWLDVEHTGYTRFAQPVRHRRIFLFEKPIGLWRITDIITGPNKHMVDWYFHFDYGIDVEAVDEKTFSTCCLGTNLVITVDAEIPIRPQIEDGWVSRRYGYKLPAKILHLSGLFNSSCRLVLTIRTIQAASNRLSENPTLTPMQT